MDGNTVSRGRLPGLSSSVFLSLAKDCLALTSNSFHDAHTVGHKEATFFIWEIYPRIWYLRTTASGTGRIQTPALVTVGTRDNVRPFRKVGLITKRTRRTACYCDGGIQANF